MSKRKSKAKGEVVSIGLIPSHLTFSHLRRIGLQRSRKWHGKLSIKDWSTLEWAGAAAGEGGEMAQEVVNLYLNAMIFARLGNAANTAKKISRVDKKIKTRANEKDRAKLVEALAKEISDTVIYLDHLAAREGIDLGEAVTKTFNETSKKFGFPERL